MVLGNYQILILLSCIVILSYGFNIISLRTRIPSVLLLIATGIGLQEAVKGMDVKLPHLNEYMQLFGTVGLILIVLEGSLDLKLSKEKLPMIRSAFGTALITLLVTGGAAAIVFQQILGVDFKRALLNVLPYAVISSSIAIPSVASLRPDKKEFLVYEATFSDILGIMVFNFVNYNETLGATSVFRFFRDLALILAISVVCCLLLLFILERIRLPIKFFLLFAIIILLYSIGKLFHFSSLVLVFVFGMMINNGLLLIPDRLIKYFHPENRVNDLKQLHLITAESAFLIRTFFFVLFGFTLDVSALADRNVILLGTLMVTIILAVRFLYLRLVVKSSIFPELFVAPRGLITVLLFFSIPAGQIIPELSGGILSFVIILTSLLMMIALMIQGRREDMEEERGYM